MTVTSQLEANKNFKGDVKKQMERFNTSQKAYVVVALNKMGHKEKEKMRTRLKRASWGAAQKVAPFIDVGMSVELSKKDSYPILEVGVFMPVMGKHRAETMDFAQLIRTGAKDFAPMRLTDLAIDQDRFVNFGGNWPTLSKSFKNMIREGFVHDDIPSIEPLFLEKGMENIERDIVRELPKVLTKAWEVSGYYARPQR